MTLALRDTTECYFDVIALGEVMLRMDPGELRIRSARRFEAWEGGGEYNVARGLSRCFGHRVAAVTALVDNEVGRLIQSLMMAGGVDTNWVRWREFDGLGNSVRNALNFTERGFGVRGAVGVADRGNSATSQLRPNDVDWDHLFGEIGCRWFHTGGIFAGLSETTAATALEAVRAARRHGTIVSYDINYRPSLWAWRGGINAAREVNREIAQHVDVIIGNEGHFTGCLNFEVTGGVHDPTSPAGSDCGSMVRNATRQFPNFRVLASTRRAGNSASRNHWSAMAWSPDTGPLEATHRADLDILDRVGGGDGFASGLIHGLLTGQGLAQALELGAAHGALAMTTPGDTSMSSLQDVENLAAGFDARTSR